MVVCIPGKCPPAVVAVNTAGVAFQIHGFIRQCVKGKLQICSVPVTLLGFCTERHPVRTGKSQCCPQIPETLWQVLDIEIRQRVADILPPLLIRLRAGIALPCSGQRHRRIHRQNKQCRYRTAERCVFPKEPVLFLAAQHGKPHRQHSAPIRQQQRHSEYADRQAEV